MRVRPPATTRRTTLGVVGLAGLAAAGCTSEGAPEPGGASGSAPPVDDDQAVVDAVVDRLRAVRSTVAAGLAGPRLRRDLQPLERMHRAHLEALGQGPALTPADSPAGAAGPVDRDQVLAAEARLQRFLVTAALRVESGALAKLLASMSASVAQHLAVLR